MSGEMLHCALLLPTMRMMICGWANACNWKNAVFTGSTFNLDASSIRQCGPKKKRTNCFASAKHKHLMFWSFIKTIHWTKSICVNVQCWTVLEQTKNFFWSFRRSAEDLGQHSVCSDQTLAKERSSGWMASSLKEEEGLQILFGQCSFRDAFQLRLLQTSEEKDCTPDPKFGRNLLIN